ncbi:uncharacterized protein [Nicotiana tomentosiformis]|uniref:uncharacterized protein n=1 Tax=Nicotiana tomentosiformis TaxID=4098 RepID=UPI00051B96F4
MEYLECKFNEVTQEADMGVRLDTQFIARKESFKYLGSIIQGNREIVFRPTKLYRAECWLVKNSNIQKMKVAEMGMLRWICGHTIFDKIRNEVIRDKVRVARMEDKMREARLRWFGHVKKRSIEVPVRRCERLASVGIMRGRGRPKKSWGEVIRRDMVQMELTKDMTLDRRVWRSKIRVES